MFCILKTDTFSVSLEGHLGLFFWISAKEFENS